MAGMNRGTGPWAAMAGRALAALGVAAGMCLAQAAQAGLGDGPDSIERDRTVMGGTADVVTSLAGYDRHEFTTANGARIHEFVSGTGAVFGVTWSGRAKPDLAALLASHYADYLKAAASNGFNHKVLSVNAEGFAMQIVRLPRGFVGSAQLPGQLPSGVRNEDIR